ncbi:MAG: bacteriophage abortive infection AbiH family protein [Prevotellaceae bacterium]|jgi:hypothetical protein|nr:bacteriophage abortive infection AbiH family protein [Prevotellaceae bacterium]
MNRIILIGNGFDLAHGLKTSYKDFIDWLWKKMNIAYNEHIKSSHEKFVYKDMVIYHTPTSSTPSPIPENIIHNKPRNGGIITKDNSQFIVRTIEYKNLFLKIITEKYQKANWVDIEDEYYEQLKLCTKNKDLNAIKKLNNDLEQIKQKLISYLKEVNPQKMGEIEPIMYSSIYSTLCLRDFTTNGRNAIVEEAYSLFQKLDRDSKCDLDIEHSWKCRKLNGKLTEDDFKQIFMEEAERDNKYEDLLPQNVLFLNFNYTDTARRYDYFGAYVEGLRKTMLLNTWQINIVRYYNHIHGRLIDIENPNHIIFGYGDELATEYKEIENLNNNEYLKNVKSINYLKTDNYKKLLDFINSESYQIFIMGHSCGNSDRTLLNTLFEHENCVSIKPYYYEWEKKDKNGNTLKDDKGNVIYENDYEEIVMNISRNFNDKKAFRDKVVNKTYCKLLPQSKNLILT